MKGGKKKGEKPLAVTPFASLFLFPPRNACHPIGKLKSKLQFFPAMSSTGSTGVIVVLLGQTASRFSLCCFVIFVSLCPPLKKVGCKTSRLPEYGAITFARF